LNNPKIISVIPIHLKNCQDYQNHFLDSFAYNKLLEYSIRQSNECRLIYRTYLYIYGDISILNNNISGIEVIENPEGINQDFFSIEKIVSDVMHSTKTKLLGKIDYMVILNPYMPIRRDLDIENALVMIINEDGDSLASVTAKKRYYFLPNQDSEEWVINPSFQNHLRDDKPHSFSANESLYIFKMEFLAAGRNNISGKYIQFEMEQWQSFEIHSDKDLSILDFISNLRKPTDCSLNFFDIELLVYDFDGVMTDNRALVDQNGKESVFVHRGDGLGISYFSKIGIHQLILSTEKNPVVKKRAEKLNIEYLQGIENKKNTLLKYLAKKKIQVEKVLYIGNDINDFEVMSMVGIPVAPSDAALEIKSLAKIVTQSPGGKGVIRELMDYFLYNNSINLYNNSINKIPKPETK